MKRNRFSFIDRLKSFKYAINGLKTLWVEEHNSRIHFAAMIIVLILGLVLSLTKTEWIIILIVIAIVFITELFNSAVENLSDFVSPEKNELIRKAKDQAAAAVLFAAFLAIIIGIIIFIPKLITLII